MDSYMAMIIRVIGKMTSYSFIVEQEISTRLWSIGEELGRLIIL